MYEEFFGLKESPFTISPNPRYLFLASQHEDALAKCTYSIEQKRGLAVVYGDVGTGKTTISRALLENFADNKAYRLAVLLNPNVRTAQAFLGDLMAEYGVKRGRSHANDLKNFMNFAADQYEKGNNLVLIVDEAQLMTPKMMEIVRALLNYETNEEKFIQIILFGQLELAVMLDKMRAIKSRVTSYSPLSGLTTSDTIEMINFRWKIAGGGDTAPFSPRAMQEIFNLSKGMPREVIKICDESLLRAALDERKEVNEFIVKAAAKELRLKEEDK